MLKKFLQQAIIIVIKLLKSSLIGGLVAAITSGVIAGGEIEVMAAALLVILFLLPAMFLYHLGFALKLKKYICDLLFFAGFLFVELFFCIAIISANMQPISDCGNEVGFTIFFLYIATFTGTAIYFAEVAFRNHNRIKELGYKEVSKKLNWGNIAGQISKQLQPILIGVIRSYIIAAVVILTVSTGPGFIDSKFEPIYITKGIIYLTGLLPAIILYHITFALKLKRWRCDTFYFSAFVAAELFILPIVLNSKAPQYVTDPNFLLSRLPAYAMFVIALGCIVVYMAEVHFRNRAVLKSYEHK